MWAVRVAHVLLFDEVGVSVRPTLFRLRKMLFSRLADSEQTFAAELEQTRRRQPHDVWQHPRLTTMAGLLFVNSCRGTRTHLVKALRVLLLGSERILARFLSV